MNGKYVFLTILCFWGIHAQKKADVTQTAQDPQTILWNLLVPPVDITTLSISALNDLEEKIIAQVKAGADFLVRVSPENATPIQINLFNCVVKGCSFDTSGKTKQEVNNWFSRLKIMITNVLSVVGTQQSRIIITTKDITDRAPLGLGTELKCRSDILTILQQVAKPKTKPLEKITPSKPPKKTTTDQPEQKKKEPDQKDQKTEPKK